MEKQRNWVAKGRPQKTADAASGTALLEVRAILENATVGILFSRSRLIVRVNLRCAQMFGYAVDEMVGQLGRILYPSDEVYAVLGREAGPILGSGAPFQTETEMRRKDGRSFLCRMSAKAVDPLHPH